MKRTPIRALVIAGCVSAATIGLAAGAQVPAPPQTPRNWSYEVDKSGNRIARVNRLVKADGSWREEVRQGNCMTIKERSATGEYKETRQCNPATPR
ncbi:MAG TPA: hypothetical protein VGU01_10370 [Sphingomicrobium sp.]|nr:hypothetical protein [Sphingomicrobium sp.]